MKGVSDNASKRKFITLRPVNNAILSGVRALVYRPFVWCQTASCCVWHNKHPLKMLSLWFSKNLEVFNWAEERGGMTDRGKTQNLAKLEDSAWSYKLNQCSYRLGCLLSIFVLLFVFSLNLCGNDGIRVSSLIWALVTTALTSRYGGEKWVNLYVTHRWTRQNIKILDRLGKRL